MRLLVLVAVLVPLLTGAAAAQPHLADLQVSLDGRDVRVSFTLAEAFDSGLEERIQAGLPTGFVYRFRLYRDHQRWFDADLGAATLEVVTMYNAVTDEYLVNTKRDGELIGSRLIQDPGQLAQAMTHFEGISLFSLAPEVPSDWRLLIRARAQLDERGRFLFMPTSVETPWARSRKFRAPALP
jgi:hypothetical protein